MKPLIKDPLNKGYLSIKDTWLNPIPWAGLKPQHSVHSAPSTELGRHGSNIKHKKPLRPGRQSHTKYIFLRKSLSGVYGRPKLLFKICQCLYSIILGPLLSSTGSSGQLPTVPLLWSGRGGRLRLVLQSTGTRDHDDGQLLAQLPRYRQHRHVQLSPGESQRNEGSAGQHRQSQGQRQTIAMVLT